MLLWLCVPKPGLPQDFIERLSCAEYANLAGGREKNLNSLATLKFFPRRNFI